MRTVSLWGTSDEDKTVLSILWLNIDLEVILKIH